MYPFLSGQNFSTSLPQFGNDPTPINVQESPLSQFSTFNSREVIDLNDNSIEVEDIRENSVQWKWEEDKLLISAWLNVSIDPLTGTDQKGETFWERIRQYCEESDHGLIKRGVVAIRKRWQRINEGAQKYGACFEKAQKLIGSGSNMDDIIEKAHILHKDTYGKKCNFDKHWSELRRQPKWRTPTTNSGSTKRTKLSDSGAYSSSANNETPDDNNIVESPVHPKGTKAAKRKAKGKKKIVDVDAERYEEMTAVQCRKLSLLEEFNKNHEKEMDLKIIMADTSIMTEAQREVHASLVEEIRRKNRK
ncbi:glutathione S-transferase T3-like [Daucus carota subsp. sativus]|uniref:glutathione S-transferase T3-like n=1 Tax=Daucus carota subsp. sativus TaxID=79200 RepID=UPI0007EFC7EB|nr:PREDICTED: glutathione S-transferase T3-like [Daucus carota subsp. sativus]